MNENINSNGSTTVELPSVSDNSFHISKPGVPRDAIGNRRIRGTVTADADVTAMAKISKIVNDLDETDRLAVIHWFGTKFIGMAA